MQVGIFLLLGESGDLGEGQVGNRWLDVAILRFFRIFLMLTPHLVAGIFPGLLRLSREMRRAVGCFIGRFDQRLNIVGDLQDRAVAETQPAREQDMLIVDVGAAAIKDRRVGRNERFWLDDEQPWLAQVGRADVTGMAMQSSRALQQQVYRRVVADHQVEVEIETLLHNLGRHQDCPIRPLPAPSLLNWSSARFSRFARSLRR